MGETALRNWDLHHVLKRADTILEELAVIAACNGVPTSHIFGSAPNFKRSLHNLVRLVRAALTRATFGLAPAFNKMETAFGQRSIASKRGSGLAI